MKLPSFLSSVANFNFIMKISFQCSDYLSVSVAFTECILSEIARGFPIQHNNIGEKCSMYEMTQMIAALKRFYCCYIFSVT